MWHITKWYVKNKIYISPEIEKYYIDQLDIPLLRGRKIK